MIIKKISPHHGGTILRSWQIPDIYLINQPEVRIGFDQIPVAETVFIDTKQELNVILQIPVYIKVGDLDPAGQRKPVDNRALLTQMNFSELIIIIISSSRVGAYLFLSAGLEGTALCRGSNSSSCWMMDLALTCTPEILILIPRRLPGPLAGIMKKSF